MLKMMPGMAGKISDEQMFEAEKRMKRCETIIAAMTEVRTFLPNFSFMIYGCVWPFFAVFGLLCLCLHIFI